MLLVKVKICGITGVEDARAAAGMGADLLGLNFCEKSPRFLSLEKAGEIVGLIPGYVDVAGVFVNASLDHIKEAVERCRLDWVQLHGDEDPDFCRSLLSMNVKTIKAIRVSSAADIERADEFYTDAILLDAYDPEKYGGTGVSFDWNMVGHMKKRVFLAGGINPDNVEAAVRLGVYGIDVCSGVESEPGRKDHSKMKMLFERVAQLRG
jgi:phosphoribosylanthranilate isomerase